VSTVDGVERAVVAVVLRHHGLLDSTIALLKQVMQTVALIVFRSHLLISCLSFL
jgi:hypothetical protein